MAQKLPWWKRLLVRPRPAKKEESATSYLSAVLAVSRAVAASLELDDLLEMVHRQVSRIFDTANFYIATYEEQTDEWILAIHVEEGKRLPPSRYKVGAGLTGHIIRHKSPLLFHSQDEMEAFRSQEGHDRVGRPALSWMGVPLLAADDVVGVMAIQSYEEEGLYDEPDLALFSTIAAQVAVAIKNARLYQEARRRADEMETLFTVSRILAASMEPQATWETIFEAVGRTIPYDAIEMCLYDDDQQTLRAVLFGTRSDFWIPEEEVYRLGEGFTGQIALTRKPLLIADVRQEQRLRPKQNEVAGIELASYVGVPLILGNRLVGTLETTSSQANLYNEHHVDLLASVGNQAAAAIERVRLFEALSRRLEEARLLLQVTQGVIGSEQLEETLDLIIRACVDAVPAADKGSLHLLEEDGLRLRIRAAVGYGPDVVEKVQLKVGQGHAGQVVRTGEPLIVDDVRQRRHVFQAGLPEVEEIRSTICIPLQVRDRTIGVISLDNLQTPRAFHEEDLETLTAFAGQAAMAIEKAHLDERLRHQVEQLRQLAQQVVEASDQARRMMETSAESIGVLEERSRQIGRFVAQVDQFAEQTDLLALNAAIEAAHAGEHGRGFAVVADEVRHLAESSSTAAGEITSLSQQILEQTEKATQQMKQVRQAVENTAQLAREAKEAGLDPSEERGA